jgi:hypothetical protein
LKHESPPGSTRDNRDQAAWRRAVERMVRHGYQPAFNLY